MTGELADKTRRGLRGRIELGKAGGGLSFGYRIVRTFKDGVVSTGEREIVPEEADIIRRIFRDYMAGLSPKQIAKDLNRYGPRGPRGALWGPSTIYGTRSAAPAFCTTSCTSAAWSGTSCAT